jgi:hypothetical protein
MTEWHTEGVSALHTECGRILDPVPIMPSVPTEAKVCEECVEPDGVATAFQRPPPRTKGEKPENDH